MFLERGYNINNQIQDQKTELIFINLQNVATENVNGFRNLKHVRFRDFLYNPAENVHVIWLFLQ